MAKGFDKKKTSEPKQKSAGQVEREKKSQQYDVVVHGRASNDATYQKVLDVCAFG